MSFYGFHRAGGARMAGTCRAVRARLRVGPGLYLRYEQSREAGEGAFGICGFWMADHLARGGGTLAEAVATFEEALRWKNDVGLFAEEVEVASGEPLGNFPQAYTHVGLVNAALTLEARARGAHREPRRGEAERPAGAEAAP
jgi:GH15 family glucan-1,4-alpha-glucosidase